jgi:predicted phage terminase large subunit-like protein
MIEFIGRDGSFRNTTVRGSVTGETLDIGIIDDPIKGREEANSHTVRDKTWNWFTDDFRTRFDEMGALLIVLTRWHTDDPVGRLITTDPRVKVLTFKAIAEEDEEFRKKGEALFPEHKSLEFLLNQKTLMPTANWQSLYQQSPVIDGGNLFKPKWFQYYQALPKLKRIIITADTAQKAKESNDYSVFECWGLGRDGNVYLIDLVRGKWEAPELLIQARAFYNKHKAHDYGQANLSCMYIEDKVSGTTLIQTMRRESGFIVGDIQRSVDKVTRAMDTIPSISSGRVYLPQGAPWLSDFLSEVEQFPNGVNDDQIDPMMDAVEQLLLKDTVDWAAIT